MQKTLERDTETVPPKSFWLLLGEDQTKPNPTRFILELVWQQSW